MSTNNKEILIGLYLIITLHLSNGHRIPYIIDGDDADEGEWPHMASLQEFGNHVCGGSLIAAQWVVTAAHCPIFGPSFYSVILGEISLTSATPSNIFDIEEILVHPEYEPLGHYADIAVLKLTEAASGDNIAPIFVDDSSDQDMWVGAECWITGWGYNEDRILPDTLQEATTEVLLQKDCENIHADTFVNITDGAICVGPFNEDVPRPDSYDSGGPLVCRLNTADDWTLVGEAMGRIPPNETTIWPTIYTRNAFYRDFIQEACENCLD